MNSLTETDKKIIIDVTDEFDYSTQNEEYNKDSKTGAEINPTTLPLTSQ